MIGRPGPCSVQSQLRISLSDVIHGGVFLRNAQNCQVCPHIISSKKLLREKWHFRDFCMVSYNLRGENARATTER
jgi:hypothetical protein